LVATGIGAAGGFGLGAKALATISTIGKIASVTATVASVGAQLTAPKPIARGSAAQVVIDIEPPRPYIVGQVMTGGVMRHDVAYGATLKKVPNPFRWQVRVLSGVGPIQGIVGEYFDFALIDNGYFGGFFNSVQNLGTRPQTTALVPPYGAAPGWTTSSRLSGCAHVGLNFKFDREGKVFASGLPIYTALCEGEKVYDPRQDSTYPGGSGACRAGVESTYVYNRNPACHAVTYALGRFQNGLRVFGLGQPVDTLDMAAIVDWANDCDANEWTVNMILTEGGTGANLREQRVRNLDDLCAAGGARWYQAGGLLSFDWHRPRLALATLTDDDILEAGGGTDAVQTVRDRMNGVRPQYTSPDHNWQQITAAEIVGSTYRTEDGGAKLTQVYPLNGVTNAAQAGELAAYAMTDSREIGPMDLQAKASWRFYRPGDCIEIDSSLVAYDGLAVINQRSLNPQSLAVSLSLKSETPGKHDFALGKVASPPPTPTLLQTTEERDLLAAAAITPRAVDVEFDDNTDLESLKPGEAGSTRNVPRGTYAAGATYVRGDSVLFSGSSYQLIVASSTGNAPPDVARWALLANAGSGPAGADGLAGISVIVDNEAHVVATAADGSGGDYSSAGGTMRLLRGDVVLTPTFSIAAQTPASPSWISINSSSGVFTVTDPGVDLATATIRAAWVGVNYDRTYTLAKSKQGVTGPRLQLTVDAQAFTFTDGAAAPSSQTITLEALLNNLSGTATWSTSPSVTLGGSGNTRTLSVANFGANRQVTVTATLGGITDKITLVRVDRDAFGGNANRLPFTRLEGGRGWLALGNFAPTPFPIAFDGLTFIVAEWTATAANQDVYLYSAPSISVTAGERLSVSSVIEVQSLLGAPPSAVWQLYVQFFDSALGSAGSPAIASGTGNDTSYTRRSSFITVPATARAASLVLLVRSAGAGSVKGSILQPMIATATADQTVHPAYVPGPNAVDGALPNNLITVDGGGVLSGIGTANIKVNNALVPLGNANRVPFSRFEGGRGWGTTGDVVAAPFLSVYQTKSYIVAQPIFSAANQFLYLFNTPLFSVNALERLSIAAHVDAFGLSGAGLNLWQLYIDYYNASDAYISSETIANGTSGVAARQSGFSTAPSNAVRAAIVLLVRSAGAGQVQMAIMEPMVTSAATGQTTHPPFTPGPNASDGADPNNIITIDGNGVINGIGTASISVDNRRSALQGLLAARPASGQFIGQEYHATDTREIYQWDGSNWRTSADITATAQRSIEPQFPSIEIKQGEAGHTGNRTVTHTAKRGTATLTGGTWSLPIVNLGAGSATINSSTGTVTLSGVVQSGAYSIRYTHTDGLLTDFPVNVSYFPTPPGGVASARVGYTENSNGVPNDDNWNAILSLTVNSVPTGRVSFSGNGSTRLSPSTGTGDADYEARLRLDGTTTLKSIASQNVVNGGVTNFTDFSELFEGSYAVTGGDRTITIELRRTNGSGRLTASFTALEATFIAT
jgi:hypothetical protein